MTLCATVLPTSLFLAVIIASVISAILIILICAAFEYFTLDDDEPKDLENFLYHLADNELVYVGMSVLTIIFFVSILLLLTAFINNLLVS